MQTATEQSNGAHHPVTGEVWALPPQSPSLAKLAAALAIAQGEFDAAEKDRTASVKSEKGNYTYKYANFASIMDAVRAPLAKNGLAITCRVRTEPKGATAVAILMHASGEWLCGEPIFVERGAATPQATGSAIEYARKYAVRTLLNIATDEEDDDGQAAATQRPAQPAQVAPPQRTTAPPPPQMAAEDVEMETIAIREHIEAATSEKDLNALVERLMKLPAQAKATLRKEWGEKRTALKNGGAK
jgi:hypothetical protein